MKLASKKTAEAFKARLESNPNTEVRGSGSKSNRRRAAVARKLAGVHRTYFKGSL